MIMSYVKFLKFGKSFRLWSDKSIRYDYAAGSNTPPSDFEAGSKLTSTYARNLCLEHLFRDCEAKRKLPGWSSLAVSMCR